MLVATLLRLYQLQFGQWRNDEEIIWLHALRAIAARRFPWVGIPSDLGIDNGPGQMLPVLPAALLQSPYVAYVLVALLNVLAVAALYRLGRLWGGRRLGLAAAALCAVSPWAVIHSRRLWGNDMLAPFAVLFVTALWLFAAGRRRWRIVEAAMWLAFVLQMYIAAVVHLAVLAVGLGLAAPNYVRRLRRTALPLLLALVAFAVLTAGYGINAFLLHISDLTRAVRDTRAATPPPVGLPNWDGFRFLIQSIYSDGYQFYAGNAAQPPAMVQVPAGAGDRIAEFLFLSGTLFIIWRLAMVTRMRRSGVPTRLNAPALLLTWLFAMPVALVIHNAPVCACFLLPSYPAQYLMVALGAVAIGNLGGHLWAFATQGGGDRQPQRAAASGKSLADGPDRLLSGQPDGVSRTLTGVLVGAVLLVQLSTAASFFHGINQYWPNDQYGLPYAWHGRIVDAVAAVWRPGMPIVVSGHGELDGVLRDEIDTRLPAGRARIIDDQRWLTLPAPNQAPMVVLLTPGASVAHDALVALLIERPAVLRATLTIPGAGQQFRVLTVSPSDAAALAERLAPPSDRHTAEVQFAGDVRLERYTLPVRLLPAARTPVALEWTILRTQPVIPAYSFYVHLVDAKRTTAMFDAPFLPPDLWRQGEWLWTFGTLSDPGQGSAARDVLIGLYQLKGTDAREGVLLIPATDRQGHAIAELRQGPFVVHAANVAAAAVPALKADFAPGVALVGADVPATGSAGSALAITLHWQATEASPPRYTVFLHLLDQHGTLSAQQDVEPGEGGFPSSAWLFHELVSDPHLLKVPRTAPVGDYHLIIGVYPTGRPERPVSMLWPAAIQVGTGE